MRLPLVALTLVLQASLPGAEKAPPGPPAWKARIEAGVADWDAGKTEAAEKSLTSALAEAEKGKDPPKDPDLALAHVTLSRILELKGKAPEAEKQFQKAKAVLDKAWTAGAGSGVLQAFTQRAEELRKLSRQSEEIPLRRLIVEVEEARAPGSFELTGACCRYAEANQLFGRFQEAEALYRRLLPLYEKLGDPGSMAGALNNAAWAQQSAGRYREALETSQRALEILEKIQDPKEIGMCLKNASEVAMKLGQYSQAEAMIQRAISLLEQTPEKVTLTKALRDLGDLRRLQGRFEEATQLLTQAWNTAPLSSILSSRAALSQVQGRLEEAEQFAQAVVSYYERKSGPDHFETAAARFRLAAIYFSEGKHEAEEAFRQSLRTQERMLGPEHPDAAETEEALGILLYGQARYPEAVPLFQTALRGRIQSFGEEHPSVAETLGRLGDLFMAMGKPKDAEAPYRRALALDEKRLGAGHPGVGSRCLHLGKCLFALDQAKAAEPFLSRALLIDEKAFGAEHPALDQDLHTLVGLYKALGDTRMLAEMDKRLQSGRARAVQEETAEAAPAAPEAPQPPKPAEPLREVPATPEGFQEARRRGLGFLQEARGAESTDFDTKRRAYTDAELAFRQALQALEGLKAAGKAPADAEEQAAEVRTFLFECHKCKPMGGKP